MAAPALLPPDQWARLRELLDAALALPASARESWFETLAEADAPLRDRLRSLLAAGDGGLPDALPRVETGDFAGHPAAPSQLGPYRLLREIGRGGMASVWLAERTDLLQQRQVALKLPHASWHGDALAARLAREREILARLEHPHIARLYDAGVGADGQPWLAMEFVDGERIDQHAARLPLRDRLRLFLQAARAVAHAHASLVVHRDLKPANMLVDARGDVKLLDFGIARLLDDGLAETSALTQQAGRAFTPQYASPEQLRGEALGTASDIFSLGVVLHELLTGRHPFAAPGAPRAALEHAVLHAEPRPPSACADDAALARALRGDLDTIVLKALKKAPQERYATAAAFAEDVERHLERRPVLARPDSLAYRLQRLVARNRVASGAGALALIALLVGAGAAAWQARLARAEAARAETVKRFVAGLFEDASPWVGPQRAPSAAELLQRARERLAATRDGDPLIRLELLNTIAASQVALQALPDAAAVLAEAQALVPSAVPATHALAQRTRLIELDLLLGQGRIADLGRAVESLLPLQWPDPADRIQVLLRAADVANNQSDYPRMERHALAALELAQQRLAADDPLQIDTRLTLANALENLGRHRESVPHARAAFEAALARHAAQPLHPQLSEVRYVYARVLHHAGDRALSLPLFRQAVADTEAVFGPQSARVATMKRALVAPLVAAQQLDEALAAIDQALPVLAREQAPDSEFIAYAHVARASIHAALQRWADARADYAHALQILAARLPENAPYLLHVRSLRAAADARLGRAAEAAAELEVIVKRQIDGRLQGAWVGVLGWAIALRLDGRPAAALELLQRHEALAEQPIQRRHLALERGLALLALQRPAEAVAPLQQAASAVAALPQTPERRQIETALARALQLSAGRP